MIGRGPSLSLFGEKMTCGSGILELMDDLGKALDGGGTRAMLGGGNPALIPEVSAVWRRRMEEILANGDEFDRMVGHYDSPQGKGRFLEAVAGLMNDQYGWGIGPENVAVTNGSQSTFFALLNLFAGKTRDGAVKRILFPLMPEYIGYADQGYTEGMFVSSRPEIEDLGGNTFKYHVDFSSLATEHLGAICVSRPTNPTGNVLTDEEIRRLAQMAGDAGVPLLVDNAYGTPFPHIIFRDVSPIWDENIVLSMSLSKIGLPSLRTGIVIARTEIIEAVTAVNAVASLSNGSVGQVLVTPLIESGEILEIANRIVRPFYEKKGRETVAWAHECFAGINYAIHALEGSLFFWVWFKDLPVTTRELYERLKARGVLVVPGSYFFYGLAEPWDHRDQCIRVTYSQADADVRTGIEIIAEEIRKLS